MSVAEDLAQWAWRHLRALFDADHPPEMATLVVERARKIMSIVEGAKSYLDDAPMVARAKGKIGALADLAILRAELHAQRERTKAAPLGKKPGGA